MRNFRLPSAGPLALSFVALLGGQAAKAAPVPPAEQHPEAKPKEAATAPEPDTSAKEFVALFNGKDLSGWKRVNGSATYEAKDGEIVGLCDPKSRLNTFLRTERDDFKDFVLTLEFKEVVDGNSGVQFRSAQLAPGQEPKMWGAAPDGRVHGYQNEIDPSDRAWTCGILDEANRGWLQSVAGDTRAAARAAYKAHAWNRVVIKAKGNHLQTWLNGVPVSDYADTDAKEARDHGFFALQVHAGKQGEIHFRDVKVMELK